MRLKPLKERKRSPEQLAQPIRDRLASIPGILVSINTPGGPGGGVQKQLQLSLQGPDTTVLDTLSQDVMHRAEAIPGLVDLDRNLKAAKPVLSVRLRRDAASDLGLGSSLVAQSLRPLFAGDETSLWRAPDGENYTVMVRLPIDERTGVADLQRIWFTAGTEPNGLPRMVHIAQIADIVNDVGASQINRRDLNREVQITANVSGRSTGEASSDLQKLLADTKLPPGYRFVFGGSTKDMAESTAYAGQALLLAVILIYLILASQFGSFLQPVAIMMSLPMSLIGVFLGAADRRHHAQSLQRHRLHHADGSGHQERHPAGRFLQPGARARHAGPRGADRGGLDPAAAHPDDHACHGVRHDAARARPR